MSEKEFKKIIYEVRSYQGQGTKDELVGYFSEISPELKEHCEKYWLSIIEHELNPNYK